jgi:hypothetical protein
VVAGWELLLPPPTIRVLFAEVILLLRLLVVCGHWRPWTWIELIHTVYWVLFRKHGVVKTTSGDDSSNNNNNNHFENRRWADSLDAGQGSTVWRRALVVHTEHCSGRGKGKIFAGETRSLLAHVLNSVATYMQVAVPSLYGQLVQMGRVERDHTKSCQLLLLCVTGTCYRKSFVISVQSRSVGRRHDRHEPSFDQRLVRYGFRAPHSPHKIIKCRTKSMPR